MIKLILIFFLFPGFSQGDERKPSGFVYNKHISGGLNIHNQGWGLNFIYGMRENNDNLSLYRLNIQEYKHQKEYPTGGSGFGSGFAPFFYGKKFNFYSFQLSKGHQILIARAAEKGGVTVSYRIHYGLTAGIKKPYYVKYLVGSDQEVEHIKYSRSTEERFLDQTSLVGPSGFSKGLAEISFLPGLHGALGIDFNWAQSAESTKSIEIGIILDAYFQEVAIMANNPGKPIFLSFFASFQLGKNW